MRDDRQVRMATIAAVLRRHLGSELPPSLTLAELDLIDPPIQFTQPLDGLDGSIQPEEEAGWSTLDDVQACSRLKKTQITLANHGFGVVVTPERIAQRTLSYPTHLALDVLGVTATLRAVIANEFSTLDIDGCGPLCAPIPSTESAAWATIADIHRSVAAHLIWPNHYGP